MRYSIRGLIPSVLIGLVACATVPDDGERTAAGASPSHTVTKNQLAGGSANLLTAIRSRVSGMRVQENSEACPRITLRGTKSMFGDNSPAVYVDGIRTTNTCILNVLSILEVNRVEIYSNGLAPHPPYKSHPHGLILVFMEQGPTEQ